ncbi:uncharacterized protein K02A2.6-like [Lacerta agilis]|uniref:uncharacterized protein K02A2.6-like n=1 Tax=Lacerta agilis TaxID=80427 RepID=UPI0014194010|nr:uncharacterized protein K02A2.6-like [Lacerta agilis]
MEDSDRHPESAEEEEEVVNAPDHAMAGSKIIEPFKPGAAEAWDSYLQRFGFAAAAQGITNSDRKKAVFLSCCGAEVFELARGLVAPLTLETATLAQITDQLTRHLAPAATKTTRRIEFHNRRQKDGESVSMFLAELKVLARQCQFVALEEALLDQFIGGLSSSKARRRIAAKEEVDLATAVREALATETAEGEKQKTPQRSTRPAAETAHAMCSQESSPSQSPSRAVGSLGAGSSGTKGRKLECPGCGGAHERRKCRFRNATCRICGKMGHIARVCRSATGGTSGSPRSSRRQENSSAHVVDDCNYLTEIEGKTVQFPAQGKASFQVSIEGHPCQMEVDSGSGFTIVSDKTARSFFLGGKLPPLEPFPATLQSYSACRIHILGMCSVNVSFKNKRAVLKLVIAKGKRTSLLGTDWFPALGLGISGLNAITIAPNTFEKLYEEFTPLFDGSLGCYKGPPINFELDQGVTPVRLKPRRVPFALQPKIEAELDKLVQQKVLEPVDSARWETPIVTPLKANGEVRICADYKCTINKAIRGNSYPIPVVSQLLAKLAGGKVFAKIDLAQAYQQLPVTPQTAEAQTIVTHKGTFKVNRLQFGVSVAPGIFQGIMERLLREVPGTLVYFDDVLISGRNPHELESRIRQVLYKFQEAGLHLKKEKCIFGVPTVDFLGYTIDAEGVHPMESKVRAIANAPKPSNKTELQSFLGLVNFYHAFLPHKAAVAEPLHRLLQKKCVWHWGKPQQKAFETIRGMLSAESVLAHYDETKPLILACDASQYGLGAVLSHREADGSDRPISFYSRTLTSTERNYAQIDREALAVVAGVKKFYDYVYGRSFLIETDHKPLLGLFNPNKQTPQILSPRMLRWSIFLNGFQYKICHVKGKLLCHADALSRLPLQGTGDCDPAPAEQVTMLETLPGAPVTAEEVVARMRKDPTLSRVLAWVGRGWPSGGQEEKFRPFVMRQHELSLHKGCILWGDRVVIPNPLRNRILETLHMGHPGMVRMKSLARCYVWWPGMDKEIEMWVNTCKTCQEVRPEVPGAPIHWWEQSKAPWNRLHIDFAGPFQGKTFLVVVDAYSKWLEVALVSSPTSAAVIKVLRRLFATHAERMVRTAKGAISRLMEGDWAARIARMLFLQHATPCTATGKSPAELLLGRRLVTVLDFVHPDRMPSRPAREPPPPEGDRTRHFNPEDLVWVRNYARGPIWVPGVISRATGPVSYHVTLSQGQVWRRHVDQLRRRIPSRSDAEEPNASALNGESPSPSQVETPALVNAPPGRTVGALPAENTELAEENELREPLAGTGVANTPEEIPQPPIPQVTTPEVRRSGRDRRKPQFLKDYVCHSR